MVTSCYLHFLLIFMDVWYGYLMLPTFCVDFFNGKLVGKYAFWSHGSVMG